jgi:hypothetical protein
MGILKNNPLQLAGTFKATCHCSTNKYQILRSEVEVNMLIARVFIVCLIISRCAAKEFSITPLEDALCCNLSYYTLENITLDDSSDTTIELIFHPGNHRLLSILEIVNKDSFSLSSLAGTNILCSNTGGILLANINHAEISNIDFLGCAYITVTNVTTCMVKNCAFTNYFKRDLTASLT